MKKIICSVLCLILLLSTGYAYADSGSFDRFQSVRTYQEGQFTDVDEGDWFAESVAAVCRLGLMEGGGDGCFYPEREMTMTEVIALAVRLNRIYTVGQDDLQRGRVWYDVYVRYAQEQGMISSRFNCRKTAKRSEFADVLSRALPEDALAEINQVENDAIPDVKTDAPYAAGIYRLYRAGIITGSDERGSFLPENGVSRAEAAAVATRMAAPMLRRQITLICSGPELPERSPAENDFFKDAAFLGNSLVDGLRLFSGMQKADYFCASSVSVQSAMYSDTTLADGREGKLTQLLAKKQYGKIYIELGINEIGMEPAAFRQQYAKLVEALQASEPEAEIYIMSLSPVTKRREAEPRSLFTMERIKSFNEELWALAEEKGCYYLDICAALADEEGYLPEEWAVDGIHLYDKYYAIWENCIRTHYQ